MFSNDTGLSTEKHTITTCVSAYESERNLSNSSWPDVGHGEAGAGGQWQRGEGMPGGRNVEFVLCGIFDSAAGMDWRKC